jgi:hypothetical protein
MFKWQNGKLSFSFTIPWWLARFFKPDPRTVAFGRSSRSWRRGPIEVQVEERYLDDTR